MAPEQGEAPELLRKQKDFLLAINRYERNPLFKFAGTLTSIANVSMQAWLVVMAMGHWSGVLPEALAIVAAILVADFVNGVVHLAMDHATGYRSAVGPFVANFHLHHRIPAYKRRNLFAVYFRESGSKFWLVIYLATVTWWLPEFLAWSPAMAHFLVLVGVFSSYAEVSHYMCHTTNYRFQSRLERIGIVLAKSHHSRHHAEDNVNYAFLNGWTNPILNRLAKFLNGGYKQAADLHGALYDIKART